MAGVSLSYKLDVPTAPLIVASLSLIFFILLGVKARKSGGKAEKG
jgi:ABC-type Mn2+/Zn2+ transport system permease subunit